MSTIVTLKGDKSIKQLITTLQKLDESWKVTYWIEIEAESNFVFDVKTGEMILKQEG